jgi:hypothetical protein
MFPDNTGPPSGGPFHSAWQDETMARSRDPDIAALRMAHNVAVTAHADCARALAATLMRGDAAPAELIEAEEGPAEEARRTLHAATVRRL